MKALGLLWRGVAEVRTAEPNTKFRAGGGDYMARLLSRSTGPVGTQVDPIMRADVEVGADPA